MLMVAPILWQPFEGFNKSGTFISTIYFPIYHVATLFASVVNVTHGISLNYSIEHESGYVLYQSHFYEAFNWLN